MVAYSFNRQFTAPALAGTKIGTIRALRKPPSRHARPGEKIQLYNGMRTKYCTLFGYATCQQVRRILLDLSGAAVFYPDDCDLVMDLDAFAVADGFTSWKHLVVFWGKKHPGVVQFEGAHIIWGASINPVPAG